VETVETSGLAGEGRGVGSGLERVVTPYSRIFSGRPWPIFERGLAPGARPSDELDAIDAALELGPALFMPECFEALEHAVLEERRSFAMFDGERWTFGPVSEEEERAWRELEQRLAQL
jgi:hypothetical protein